MKIGKTITLGLFVLLMISVVTVRADPIGAYCDLPGDGGLPLIPQLIPYQHNFYTPKNTMLSIDESICSSSKPPFVNTHMGMELIDSVKHGHAEFEIGYLPYNSGSFTYMPDVDFTGSDSFTYRCGLDSSEFGYCHSETTTATIIVGDGIPAPEFPSTILPAAVIIGFLGSVLLIRRTREN